MASTRPGYQKVSANMPEELYKQLKNYCYVTGLSLSSIMNLAVTEWLKEHDDTQESGK